MSTHRRLLQALSIVVILTLLFSGFQLPAASAQGKDGLKRQVNAQTGKVSLLSPESGRVLSAAKALGAAPGIHPADPAMALAKRFGPEFGLQDSERDLTEMKMKRQDDGRMTVRYQQNYEGIPVIGGELIVNTNENGDLYSMNGEVSPDLSLPTQPTIDAEQARQTALEAAAKWYEKATEDLLTSEPELWIFDENLLRPSTRPVELVWRMEVTPKDVAMPVRELVLVNAERGTISLHFNQVDTEYGIGESSTALQDPDPTPTPLPTETPVLSETPLPTETPLPSETPELALNSSWEETSARDVSIAGAASLTDTTWYVATTGNDTNSCSVPEAPCPTINGAIDKAAPGDTVKVAIGTYTGTGTEVVLINKSVTLSGGWDASFTAQNESSTIDGQRARRGVFVSAASSLDHFIIMNGNANGSGYDAQGGGIFSLENVSIIITNSLIQNNSAKSAGGGISKVTGNLTLTNTIVSNNSATGVGGGINSSYVSSLTLNNSSINGNISFQGGGGISHNNGLLILNNTTVSSNSADHGGGIYNHTASLALNNATVSDNLVAGSGGGLYVQAGSVSNVSLRNSIIGDNFSKTGLDCSGLVSSGGNNIISNTSGCGITPVNGDKFNISPMLGTFLPAPGYHPLLAGSPAINAGNPATCLSADQRGVARIGTCDIGAYEYTVPGSAMSLASVSGGGQRTLPTFAFAKPLKAVALDSQGTPVANVSITFTAPGNGTGALFANTGTNTTSVQTDSHGVATTPILIANSQFGAYNVSASASGLSSVSFSLENTGWYVSPAGSDSNSCSVPASPCLTIDSAINKARTDEMIAVAVGTYTGTSNNVITISKGLRLLGGWNNSFTTQTGVSIIDGQNSRRGVSYYAGVAVTTTLERFAIINTNVMSDGGGINNGGVLTLNNVTLSNNSAYYGAGIYNSSSGMLTLNNVTVSNNNAWFGGGIYNAYGRVAIQNTLIANNISSNQGPDCFGTISAADLSLIGNGTNCQVANGAGNLLNVNPRLDTFNSAGGYHPLLLGSPAIDAGDNRTCASTDQRGVARPQGLFCDIGAYEYKLNSDLSNLLITTYDAENSSTLPGRFVCNQTDLDCRDGDLHEKGAHQYAAGTYNLYKSAHNRNSIDGNGIEIISSVHYKSNYQNAFWNGYMMVFGDGYGYPLADDVVAHEFTHGVTQYESNLFYYYQSGAINESLSDLWGEYYDQSNGLGTDTDSVKWKIGEDVQNPTLMRSMSDPTIYGDPDRMSSSLYYAGEGDSGGVHYNSGINNKAAYLMVNGGDFNTKSVSPLGWVKTAAIYYEANTNLITSGTDYSDLYYILQQACSNLVGTKGIMPEDCVEVKDAVEAVEMHLEPRPTFNADAPYCPAGATMTPLFSDDLESGTANWTFNNGAYPRWQVNSSFYGPYARSGLYSLYADDYPAVATDATARLGSFDIPLDAYLRFSHAYEFETGYYLGNVYNFDGGVLEYSINGGSSWLDASSLLEDNGYKGVLYTGTGNPLSGRSAFVGSSHGYLSTRVNLASLVGKTVSFRWRMGLDNGADTGGWWVDDVEIYQCIDPTANVSVTIGDTLVGKRTVNAQPSLLMNFPDRLDGPVKVIGKDGMPIVTSQRVVFGNSFNELMGYPADQFTTEYWFPWYDMVYMNTWVLVGNPSSTQTAYVDIYIGGVKRNGTGGGVPYTIPPGARILPQFPGVLDGPVRVVSVTGAGTSTPLPIFASERSTYLSSFNEVMGYPADQFTTEYWFPWYDQVYMNSWVLVGNPSSTQTAYVDIYIAGVKRNTTPGGIPYAIPPNGRVLPQFPRLMDGPVRVVSVTGLGTPTPLPIFASERSTYQGSFNEVMGYPANQFTTDYWYTWYDNLGMASWVLVGNPSTIQTAYVDIYIAGVKQGSTFVIPPSDSVIPRFPLSNGPVHIVSVTGEGTPTAIPVFTSERSLYGPSFNEVMGYPANQLSSEYWFTWYDSVYMTTELYVSKP